MTKVVIEVRGGIVQEVHSNENIDVTIIDYDNTSGAEYPEDVQPEEWQIYASAKGKEVISIWVEEERKRIREMIEEQKPEEDKELNLTS